MEMPVFWFRSIRPWAVIVSFWPLWGILGWISQFWITTAKLAKMKSTVIAVLDYNCKVSEDEIHCARDAILGVKLAVGVHVECGLVRLDVALVNNGEVAANSQRHGLALAWPSVVDDSQALGYEA
jgi:hypothetical protein